MQDSKKVDRRSCLDALSKEDSFFPYHCPPFTNIIQLIEQQVRKRPDEIAIVYEDETLSYSDLCKRMDRLAVYLHRQGLASGSIVALYLDNGIDLVAAILAILKAGGVYLPLDPQYPPGRVQYMIDDARPSFFLTRRGLAYPEHNDNFQVIEIDQCWEESWQESDVEVAIHPDQLAYVIYTSGSTGSPKGIMVSHRSLVEAIRVRKNVYPELPVGLLTCSISFDPSILIIFYDLASGGMLCISPVDQKLDMQKINELIVKQNVNFLICVPSYYSMILERCENLITLKHVSLAGESISHSLITMHAQYAPFASLVNEYGPSEYAIGTTWAEIYDPEQKIIHPITVGKPFENAIVLILDENFQMVPAGAKGEIFIGGVGLAIGYLNKEELNKEKFLHISLQNLPPIRLYRSGDFGRFSPQRDLEFLGRMDHQVKIRGYRIELAEIEQTICQYPGIDKVAVIVKEDKDANKRLIAFYSSLQNACLVNELMQFLRDKLPEQMLPSALIHLQQFIYTPNGKIDREYLRQLNMPCKLKHDESLQPNSSLQEQLLRMWKDILKQENINIHDHFFEVGGDSIRIATLQARIQSVLGFDVPIADLFTFPTIDKLSARLLGHTTPIANKKKVDFRQFKKREKQC